MYFPFYHNSILLFWKFNVLGFKQKKICVKIQHLFRLMLY